MWENELYKKINRYPCYYYWWAQFLKPSNKKRSILQAVLVHNHLIIIIGQKKLWASGTDSYFIDL